MTHDYNITTRSPRFLQVLLDVMHSVDSAFTESTFAYDSEAHSLWRQGLFHNDRALYCAAGPGARRGLNRVYSRPVGFCVDRDSGELEALQLREIQQLKEYMESQNPKWCSKMSLEVQDVQFQLCEFDKYVRIQRGERGGRAREYVLRR